MSTALVNDTLNYYFQESMKPPEAEEDSEEEDDQEYYEILAKVEDTIDGECVKEKLNLPENGRKAVLEFEATILIASAKSKCIKTSIFDFGETFLNFTVRQRPTTEDYIFCTKYKLQKLESTNAIEENEKRCENHYIYIDDYTMLEWKYDRANGPLNETTCGAFTHDIVEIISYKTALLAVEEDKDLKENNMKELFTYATDKLHKLGDCILERI